MQRNKTREIKIGNKYIGNNHDILIQSMCNTKTEDIESTIKQIKDLEKAGCDIIRVAVPSFEAAKALKEIKKKISIPLVADIHFDYKLAIESVENGADKIRINPGNIGDNKRLKMVVDACKKRQIPIRVGVNSGSLEKHILNKYGGVTKEGIVESALEKINLIREFDYENLVVSIKSSDVLMTIKAHELLVKEIDFPIHIGITESGTLKRGLIKSSAGIGILLAKGIGDTIRISLTLDPVEEVLAAKILLKSLGLRKGGIEVVACPTCGRTSIDLISLANKVEDMVKDYDIDLKLAVMGCIVNGPGEAKEADLGIAGGNGTGLIIKKGKVIKSVKEEELLFELKKELDKLIRG